MFHDELDFFTSSIAVSVATLARYAGSSAGDAWLPDSSSVGSPSWEPGREYVEDERGVFEGYSLSLPAPGTEGHVRVFRGVEKRVLEGVRNRSLAEVEEAQSRFAPEGRDSNSGAPVSDERMREVTAVSSEGAILVLSLEK